MLPPKLVSRLTKLPRHSKRIIAALVDCCLCAISAYTAVFLRIGEMPQSGWQLWLTIAISVALVLPIFRLLGLYREIFSQAGFRAVIEIGRACALYCLCYAAIFTFGGIVGIPRTVGLIQPVLLFLLVAASRIFARYWLHGSEPRRLSGERPLRVMIYGAGSAGRQLATVIGHDRTMQLVGFIDDDTKLVGSAIDRKPIFPGHRVAEIVERFGITDLLFAIPSITRQRRNELIDAMSDVAVHIRTLPGIMDVAHGRVSLSDVRELDIEDLLGRDTVPPDPELLRHDITGKTVMVTGAGGSIGSELCRQILNGQPDTLLLVETSEYALYTIHAELLERQQSEGRPSIRIVPLLGSVTDQARIGVILETWNPHTIYHAAAYKHVPLVEHNPSEGLTNNIFGTRTVAALAGKYGVPKFVLISTDKAVRPTNIMGASKRVAELILQALNDEFPNTAFSMVRFGNVLNSSGSVVPLFRRQIDVGGPITITDYRITRYFMTIREAAELVIQAGAMARGGEVFVLDMGDPVPIVRLARDMIRLSGYRVREFGAPSGDIEIVEVGLRPGEKLYEELLIGNNPTSTSHPRIFKAREAYFSQEVLDEKLSRLASAMGSGHFDLIPERISQIVAEFKPQHEIVDWCFARVGEQRRAVNSDIVELS